MIAGRKLTRVLDRDDFLCGVSATAVVGLVFVSSSLSSSSPSSSDSKSSAPGRSSSSTGGCCLDVPPWVTPGCPNPEADVFPSATSLFSWAFATKGADFVRLESLGRCAGGDADPLGPDKAGVRGV